MHKFLKVWYKIIMNIKYERLNYQLLRLSYSALMLQSVQNFHKLETLCQRAGENIYIYIL